MSLTFRRWRRCRPKEEIYAKLLYVINAPAQQLVTVMNGVGRNLAVVVDQGVKENKFSGIAGSQDLQGLRAVKI